MKRAVRRVQVDRQQRVPSMQHIRDQPTRLGRLQLHVIAIEIEILSILPHADAFRRTVLRFSMLIRDLLVAVRVVDRRDQHDEAVAQLSR